MKVNVRGGGLLIGFLLGLVAAGAAWLYVLVGMPK